MPLIAAGALARPFEDALPLLPVWQYENWARASTIWTVLGATALLIAARALWLDARPRTTTPRLRSRAS